MGEAEGIERRETHRKNITEKKSMHCCSGIKQAKRAQDKPGAALLLQVDERRGGGSRKGRRKCESSPPQAASLFPKRTPSCYSIS